MPPYVAFLFCNRFATVVGEASAEIAGWQGRASQARPLGRGAGDRLAGKATPTATDSSTSTLSLSLSHTEQNTYEFDRLGMGRVVIATHEAPLNGLGTPVDGGAEALRDHTKAPHFVVSYCDRREELTLLCEC